MNHILRDYTHQLLGIHDITPHLVYTDSKIFLNYYVLHNADFLFQKMHFHLIQHTAHLLEE